MERRGDLDRIRLVLAAVAFLAACGVPAADRWMAPAFFAVAGFAAVPSFRGRHFGEWAVAKVLRLFVPALVGTLLVVLPLLYLERPGEVDEWAGHLLFLPALLACSLAMTPLLVRLTRSPAAPLAPVILLSLSAALPAAIAAAAGSAAWAVSVAACAAAGTLGAVTASGPAAEAAFVRLRLPVLVGSMALAGAAVALRLTGAAPAAWPVVDAAAQGALASAVLALGLRRSTAGRQVPSRLNEWILPFFVFSRPAFLAVGRAMASLSIASIPRAAIAAVLAAAITLAACELARRSILLRFLTGLRERSDAS